MITRRTFTVTALLAPLAAAVVPAQAAQKYSADALAAAQKTGKPVLVEVFAPWCPTCRAQRTVLSELEKDARFADFIRLTVDFDSQKSELKVLKVNSQSTLIVYKGTDEVGRAVGITSKQSIADLLSMALV